MRAGSGIPAGGRSTHARIFSTMLIRGLQYCPHMTVERTRIADHDGWSTRRIQKRERAAIDGLTDGAGRSIH